ncbi:MAG: hypothetical protein U0984_00650 [Prosthecobacter sp.]|nr:hypothetical protein [Prosthecobacter sp.]
MPGFRLTKYNPSLRAENGAYSRVEWTSISDVGTAYASGTFTHEEYLTVEAAYLETIRGFMAAANVESLRVCSLETDSDALHSEAVRKVAPHIHSLREGTIVSGIQVDEIARLNLRELLWCRLAGDHEFHVHFGYDYYMYIGTSLPGFMLPALPPLMFAEPVESPYLLEEEL